MLLDRLGGVGATGSLLGRQLLPLKVKTPIKPWKTENTHLHYYTPNTDTHIITALKHTHYYTLKTHTHIIAPEKHTHYCTLKTHTN